MSFLWYWPKGGWDFDKWRGAQTWKPVKSQQSGDPKPQRLVSDSETLENWKKDAGHIRGIVGELLGKLTDVPPGKATFERLGEEFVAPKGGYTFQRISYPLTASGEVGFAWLLMPIKPRSSKIPAVIVLHQTTPAGKHEAIGLELRPGGEYLTYGADLAARGFAVLAPDVIAFGERMAESGGAKYHSADEFFAVHPEGSVMGKMAFDTSRAVDLLQAMPGVDGERIGCIGHSHGGYGTLFAMLGDDRISAGVISCGITLFRADPTPERWFRMTSLIPRLGLYNPISDTPIDFHHLVALCAPRAVFVNAGLRDGIFPNTAPVQGALEESRKVYALYGAGEELRTHFFDGPHGFPADARKSAYDMLEKVLKL